MVQYHEKFYSGGGGMQFYSLRSALRDEAGFGDLSTGDEYIDKVMLVIQKMLFCVDTSRFSEFRLTELVSNDGGFTFSWVSKSEHSNCPRCGAESTTKRNTYKTRVLIDEPILGMPVMHHITENVYICEHCSLSGDKKSFVEDISTICRRPYIKTTTNLDEKIVNDAVARSANGLANEYKGNINISSGTILNRLKEAGGMATEKNLTETDGVEVVSIDDNNARKGSSPSASTVVIDVERHIILVAARGADSGNAKKIFGRFPDAKWLSRDRACAYAKAGDECNLEQVADIFHLIQNAHAAVKEAISRGMDYNIYVKEGDGWVELPADGSLPESAPITDDVPIMTLADDDVSLRVRLASLSARQESKYRTTIELMRLTDQGLSSKEIDNRLGISRSARIKLYCDAPDVINSVEDKIDEYYGNWGTRKGRQKTIGKRAGPSGRSIVAPYGDTVMSMVGEGHNHRSIHPVIKEMGFEGSANAIYQYILKRRLEDSPESTAMPEAGIQCTRLPDGVPPRPPRVSLQRTTKTAVYKFVLHETAVRRESAEQERSGKQEIGEETETTQESNGPKPSQKRSRFYSESVSEIIKGTPKEAQDKKKHH